MAPVAGVGGPDAGEAYAGMHAYVEWTSDVAYYPVDMEILGVCVETEYVDVHDYVGPRRDLCPSNWSALTLPNTPYTEWNGARTEPVDG